MTEVGRGFIFCPRNVFLTQIGNVLSQNNISWQKFTTDVKKKYQRDILLNFSKNSLDAIAAIDCLNEGVDIPDAKMAYGHSAKMDSLLSLLDSLMSEGRRVLVFSQFTSMLQLIENELNDRNYPLLHF